MNYCDDFVQAHRYFKYQSVLGRGTFGTVFLAVDPDNEEEFAVKCSPKTGKFLSREYEILTKISGSKHCIQLLGIFYTLNEEKDATQHLVFEYMPSSLWQYLNELRLLNEKLPIDKSVKIMKQILKGLKEIHSKGIMHRDIKPENILIDPRTLKIKICDFGSAKLINDDKNIPLVVSKAYRAPELTLQCTKYGTEIDIWSAACIFLEFFTGRSIFNGKSEGEQIYHQVKLLGPVPETCSIFRNSPLNKSILQKINQFGAKADLEEYFKGIPHSNQFVDLIKKMMNYDQSQRFTASECLNHEFFNNFK